MSKIKSRPRWYGVQTHPEAVLESEMNAGEIEAIRVKAWQ